MIEAFSDEQMSSDMAVIESVLDIFDKTILMMELSNEPVDIPDVSMFMESAFFQEQNEGDQSQAADGDTGDGEESNPAQTADQSSGNNTSSDNNTQNNTMSEADRKAYNKEHWVRMKNKEGKLENIFISIIAFIPRLLGFLIQCIVRFFKKLFNKEADEEIKKSDSSVQTLSPEEITEAVSKTNEGSVESSDNANSSESKEPPAQSSAPATPAPTPAPANNNAQPPQPNATNEQKNAGTINPQTKMWEWYDEQNIIKCIENCEKIIKLFTLDNYSNIQKLKKFMPDITKQFGETMKARIEVQGNVLVNSKNNITNRFNAFEKSIEGTKAELDKYIKDNNLIKKKLFGKDKVSTKGQEVLDLKNSVNLLKNFSKSFSDGSTEIIKSYNKTVRRARALNNAAANKGSSQPQAQPQQNQGQPQPPQPPVNNNGGGENNG
jgi:hypothetical protein